MIMFNHFFPLFVSNKLNRKWPIVKICSVSGRMWIKLFIRLQYSFLIFLCLSNKKRNDRLSYCRKIEGSNTVYLFISLLTLFYYERLSSFSFLVGCDTSVLSSSVIGSDRYKKMALYGGDIVPGYDDHTRTVIP